MTTTQTHTSDLLALLGEVPSLQKVEDSKWDISFAAKIPQKKAIEFLDAWIEKAKRLYIEGRMELQIEHEPGVNHLFFLGRDKECPAQMHTMNGIAVSAKFNLGLSVHVFDDGTVRLSIEPEAVSKDSDSSGNFCGS
jgi:hypothetical protein